MPQRPGRASRFRTTLFAWLGIALGALVILQAFGIPLGQGSFVYHYSELSRERIFRACLLVFPAAVFVAGVYLVEQRRLIGRWLLVLSLIGFCCWTWWAPPSPFMQHTFNLRSPSNDGAFLLESYRVQSAQKYLQEFDARVANPPEKMGGTRIISNPPGLTLLMHLTHELPADRIDRFMVEHLDAEPADAGISRDTLLASILLTGMWAASGVAAYLLGTLFLREPWAAVFALLVTFNPCTVNFSPGKDPAQLLTINLMLVCWFAAVKRNSIPLAAVAGAVMLLGATLGLIHIWVALAVVIASRRVKLILAGLLGVLIVTIAIYLLSGWNVPRTFLIVAMRFHEIQGTLALNRGIWLLIGLPIFLMFVSPVLMAIGLRAPTRLMLSTLIVMGVTYIFGVPYELPRLWMAFVPLLVMGAMQGSTIVRVRRPTGWIAVLAAVHLIFTAGNWTRLDARESELRLSSGRFFK